MSRADAIRDGIEFEADKWGSVTCYKIPCAQCGKKYGSRQYTGKRVYICPTCREIIKKKNEAHVQQLALSIPDAETKEEKRYRKAVEQIEKQVGSLNEYRQAIEVCRKATFKYGSTPEAMIAIELVRNRYRVIPQQKVGKYHVDFALPNEKLIIEVDGSIYHTNRQKELEREGYINFSIGLDWRIIHIPAESITDDVRKVVRLLKSGTQGTTNSANM